MWLTRLIKIKCYHWKIVLISHLFHIWNGWNLTPSDSAYGLLVLLMIDVCNSILSTIVAQKFSFLSSPILYFYRGEDYRLCVVSLYSQKDVFYCITFYRPSNFWYIVVQSQRVNKNHRVHYESDLLEEKRKIFLSR